ncbi:PstS family phosphate ABC transporter substrate-binding protein [uncultured Microscilla sp.]|uniref:PstS family phosphate ABC transporter substrate-binding protein n=1 Tax=uncultured Microscilla sp. TaxID=432653 RepID=UPI0026323FB5|nr:PstS family phosphate ABC transporter substrate-binding protein [uncultured Microscilla sp.]
MKFIVRLILLIVLLAGTEACSRKKTSLKIKGSDSVLPISQKAAEIFMQQYPKVSITVTGGGSGVGIAALINGTTHIAMTSRQIKISEQLKIQAADKKIKEDIIGHDALALVVHPSNPVKKLTREQIEGIFTGNIKTWQEVGGGSGNIVAYSRETSSGTYEYFKKKALNGSEYGNTVLSLNSNGAIIQSVSQTKGSIGYIGLAYISSKTKALAVSFDHGKSFVMPTFENAKQKKYPISRPLFYYYDQSQTTKVGAFMQYLYSPTGQKLIKDIGYIPNR